MLEMKRTRNKNDILRNGGEREKNDKEMEIKMFKKLLRARSILKYFFFRGKSALISRKGEGGKIQFDYHDKIVLVI
jgi:hypothetical protein